MGIYATKLMNAIPTILDIPKIYLKQYCRYKETQAYLNHIMPKIHIILLNSSFYNIEMHDLTHIH